MNTVAHKLAAVILLLLPLVGCRPDGDDLINPNDRYADTLTSQFEAFWSGMAQSYVFWDVDTVDWVARHAIYAPKFRELDRQEYVSSSELSKLYTQLADGLLDHHLRIQIVNLRAKPGSSGNIDLYPGINEIRRRPGFHELISEDLFQSVYAAYERSGRLAQLRSATALVDGSPLHVASGILDGNVAYLHFSAFSLSRLVNIEPEFVDPEKGYDNPGAVAAYKAWVEMLDNPGVSRVILDMRSNLGGDMNDILLTTSLLTDREVRLGETRAKNGLGALDYGPWTPLDIPAGSAGSCPFTIVITDTWSCSMAELTALAAPLLPGGGVIVGERTFGATGPRTGVYPITFNGMFSTLDGTLAVTMATWATRFMPDGARLEGEGVTPQVAVATDLDAMAEGRDPQLEKALAL